MACPVSTLLGNDACGRLDSVGSAACAVRQLPSALWTRATSLAPWQIALIAIVVVAKLPALLAWAREWAESLRPVPFSHPPPPVSACLLAPHTAR